MLIVFTAFFASSALAGTNFVYLGGIPIGVVAQSSGVTIIDFHEVVGQNGSSNPARDAGLLKGDLIYMINDVMVNTPSDLMKVLHKECRKESIVTVKVLRKNQSKEFRVMPLIDKVTNEYKIGLSVRNDLTGIGVLTFISSTGKYFGGLGHKIFDAESNNSDIYNDGYIYDAQIIGYDRAKPGLAGALRGKFANSEALIGRINKNNWAGIYGIASGELTKNLSKIVVGNRANVKCGPAFIYSTISGNTPIKYEIEIIKAETQNEPRDKGLVIRIIDKRLLNHTGGILQGMSGSPIVQDDHIIGAVTHVFINDATCGYGIYIDWMLQNVS
jgi:stage IV sporulation protein B